LSSRFASCFLIVPGGVSDPRQPGRHTERGNDLGPKSTAPSVIELARQTALVKPSLDRRPGHAISLNDVAYAEPAGVRVRSGVRFDGVARKHETRPDLPERNARALQQQAGRAGLSLSDNSRGLGGR